MAYMEDFIIDESPIFLKIFGVATGVSMSICFLLTFIWVHAYPMGIVIQTYLFFFGALMAIMEAYNGTSKIGQLRKSLYANFGLIRTAQGRGVLYLLTGALVIVLFPATLEWQIIDFVLGGSLCLLGICSLAAHYVQKKR